jgi:hypothetical protein
MTRDISSTGVLFTAAREMDIGGTVEYAITLHAERHRRVILRCIGKVVRYDKAPSAVAVTLERYEFERPGK